MGHAFGIRIQGANMFQAFRIDVADSLEVAVRKTSEVADQQRSPITASDHADRDLFLHMFRADPLRLAKSGWRVSYDSFEPILRPFVKLARVRDELDSADQI